MTTQTAKVSGDSVLTWALLVQLEPELEALYREIRTLRGKGGRVFCANRVWYSRFKGRLLRLVGWEARNPDPRIRSAEAYDLAYQKLYDALPNCRNCSCL